MGLKQRVGVLVTALTLAGLANPIPATAAPTGGTNCNLTNDQLNGQCGSEVQLPGDGGGSGKPGRSGGSGGGPRVCKRADGTELPCEFGGDTWIDSVSRYCQVDEAQPPKDEPIWEGNTTGAIWKCAVAREPATGKGVVFSHIWLPSATPPPPDPEVLARQAVAQMRLRAVEIGISPRTLETDPNSMGAVGLPVWMWVAQQNDPEVVGPQSRTASLDGWSVTAQARMKQVVWDMGDGSEKRFCATGTPYYAGAGVKDSPDCGYRYQKQGIYTVKATSQWEVTWSGLGHSGVIPLEFTTTGSVRIGEIQTVITKPKP